MIINRPWLDAPKYEPMKPRLYYGDDVKVVAQQAVPHFSISFTKKQMDDYVAEPVAFYKLLSEILIERFPICPRLKMRNYQVNLNAIYIYFHV